MESQYTALWLGGALPWPEEAAGLACSLAERSVFRGKDWLALASLICCDRRNSHGSSPLRPRLESRMEERYEDYA